jgi:hypothetical protein
VRSRAERPAGIGKSLLDATHASLVHGDEHTDGDPDADASATSDADDATVDGGVETDVNASDGVETDVDASDGVDTEHVMNLTFVLTLLFGVPTVVVLSLFVPLNGWNEIIGFVVRVGAGIWFLTAVGLYVRERWLK